LNKFQSNALTESYGTQKIPHCSLWIVLHDTENKSHYRMTYDVKIGILNFWTQLINRK
jgi:hypothetical protein